jgi:hypothetical protein
MLFTGVTAFVDNLQTDDLNQSPHTVVASLEPVCEQVCGNPVAAKERVLRKDPINLILQFQHLGIHAEMRVTQQ